MDFFNPVPVGFKKLIEMKCVFRQGNIKTGGNTWNQKNCVFNFKNDEVSLYDFVPYVDLLLNSSSVTSYEFGLYLRYFLNLRRYLSRSSEKWISFFTLLLSSITLSIRLSPSLISLNVPKISL